MKNVPIILTRLKVLLDDAGLCSICLLIKDMTEDATTYLGLGIKCKKM